MIDNNSVLFINYIGLDENTSLKKKFKFPGVFTNLFTKSILLQKLL